MRPDLLLLYIPWFRFEPWEIPHPASLSLFGWELTLPDEMSVHPFGVLVAIGVLLGARVAELKGKRTGLRPSAVGHAAAHVLIPAFVLAHVLDAVLYHPEIVRERPLFVLELWNGLSSYGGFCGAVLGGAYYVHRYRVPIRVIADPMAFAFPFGWLFGRLGCFGVHDHPGRVTMFFLGVADYEVGYPPWQVRHDLGLYEVFWSLAVIAIFLVLARRERARGLYLGLLPVLYAPVRFGLDFLRATDIEGADTRYFGLTPGHYGSVLLGAAGLVVLARALRDPDLAIPAFVALAPPAELPAGEVRVEEETHEEARGVGEQRPDEGEAHGERPEERSLREHGEGLGDSDGGPPAGHEIVRELGDDEPHERVGDAAARKGDGEPLP